MASTEAVSRTEYQLTNVRTLPRKPTLCDVLTCENISGGPVVDDVGEVAQVCMTHLMELRKRKRQWMEVEVVAAMARAAARFHQRTNSHANIRFNIKF